MWYCIRKPGSQEEILSVCSRIRVSLFFSDEEVGHEEGQHEEDQHEEGCDEGHDEAQGRMVERG